MANTFLKNFSFLTIGELSARAIGMFTNVILARFLAPEGYGQYTLVLTYIAILYSLSCLGVNQLTIRYIARNQNDSRFYLRLSLFFRAFGFVLSTLGFIVYANLTSSPINSQFILYVILACVFLENIWVAFQNVAFGMQRMEWNAVINVAFAAINLAIYLILPSKLINIQTVLGVYLLVYVAKDVAYYICLSKSKLLRWENKMLAINKETCASFLNESVPFYILLVFGLLTNQLPTIFLENNSNMEEVAYFGTANKLLLPLTVFMNTALTAFFPNQSQLFVKDKQLFQKNTVKMITILTGLGIILSAIISLFRWEVVELLYGKVYTCTADVMSYQCWYFVLFSLFSINGVTLGAADAQKTLAACSIIYGIISTPILYYASFYGAQGLSMGYIVASFINLTYILFVLKRVLVNALTIRFITRYLFIFVLCFLAVTSISSSIGIQYRLLLLAILIALCCCGRHKIYSYVKS